MQGREIIIVIGIALIFGALAYFNYLQAKKRREAFARLAQELGLNFRPERDSGFARSYRFLNQMGDGSNRYAFNVLTGTIENQPVHIFDYHYETYSTGRKGRRKTHHHFLSIFALTLPTTFPEILITREHAFAKVFQALGFDDIDFESVEFSKRYNVRSSDKKFAYDVCNGQMIDYLLAQPDLNIELDRDTLCLAYHGRLAVEGIRPNLERLLKIRSFIPDYLF